MIKTLIGVNVVEKKFLGKREGIGIATIHVRQVKRIEV